MIFSNNFVIMNVVHKLVLNDIPYCYKIGLKHRHKKDRPALLLAEC